MHCMYVHELDPLPYPKLQDEVCYNLSAASADAYFFHGHAFLRSIMHVCIACVCCNIALHAWISNTIN